MKRNFLALVVLSLFISIMQGCNTKESVDLKMVAEKFSQAVNKQDANAIASFYSENAIMYLSGEKEPIKGREAIIKSNQSMFRAFPDLNTDFLNIFTSEGYFIAEGITRGTHSGPLSTPEGDVQPTGRQIEIKFVFIAKCNSEGLIIEDRTYFDSADMGKQLELN